MSTDVDYALKIVSKSTLTKSRARQKLQAEIKIHRTLRHRHVVRFDRFFEDSRNAYILLELCSMGSLSEMVKRRKRLSEREMQLIMMQIVEGVRYMHRVGVIHRDLKLGNVFLDGGMNVKIGDLGLAAQVSHAQEQRKTICGTPNYIAPEILDGKTGHSFQVDIWSLGVILYTCLVGRPPYESRDVKSTYKRILANVYTFPDHVTISDDAKALIRRMLQTRPESRPTLEEIVQHPFFSADRRAVPRSLPPSAKTTAPVFDDLGRCVEDRARRGENPAGADKCNGKLDINNVKEEGARERRVLGSLENRRAARTAPPGEGRGPKVAPNGDAARKAAPNGDAGRKAVPGGARAAPAGARPALERPAKDLRLSEAKEGAFAVYDESKRSKRSEKKGGVPSAKKGAGKWGDGASAPAPGGPGGRRKAPAPAPAAGPRPLAAAGPDPKAPAGSDPRAAAGPDSKVPAPALEAVTPARSEQVVADCGTLEAMHKTLERSFRASAHGGSARREVATELAEAAGEARPTVWVSRFVDYTSKYGLGFLLSSGSAGVYFNDSTKIVLSPDGRRFAYVERRRHTARGSEHLARYFDVDRYPSELKKKVTLLKHFDAYLQDQERAAPRPRAAARVADEDLVFLKKWVRTRHAILFRLSNRTVQVVFFDHSEVLLSAGATSVTYVDKQGRRDTLSLAEVMDEQRVDISKRLKYAKDILSQLIAGAPPKHKGRN